MSKKQSFTKFGDNSSYAELNHSQTRNMLNTQPHCHNLSKKNKTVGMFKKSIINCMSEDALLAKVLQYENLMRRIKIIDTLSTLIDLITICLFYWDHFDYLDADFGLSDNSNILRIILLLASLLVCFGIFLRFKFKLALNGILYELGNKKDNNGLQSKKRRIKNMVCEMIVHLIQPYPYAMYKWEMLVIGSTVTYTLNMILYFFAMFRAYMIIKVIRYWNLYSTVRSKKILRFFDKYSNSDVFLYKANLDQRGFITLTLVAVSTLLYFSLLLKVLEYYQKTDSNVFDYYWNSLWYLVVTMGTIGYGDITPKTVLGRVIGVIVCLIGVVILSLLVVTLTIFTYLDNDELLAYNAINSLSTSFGLKKEIQEYVRKILISRLKFRFKRMDLDCIVDKYKRNLKKVEYNIELHKPKAGKNIHNEFIQNVRDIAEKQLDPLCEGFKGMWSFEENYEEYLGTNDKLNDICKKTKNIMISCLNLGKCLATVGSIANLESITEIQHKKAISDHMLHRARNAYKKKQTFDSKVKSNMSESIHERSGINYENQSEEEDTSNQKQRESKTDSNEQSESQSQSQSVSESNS